MIPAEFQVEESAVTRQIAAMLPWHDGPRRLVSWWEMQRFDAGKYLVVAGNLSGMSQSFAMMTPFPLSELNLENVSRQFLERAAECRELGLPVSADQFQTAAETLTDKPGTVYSIQIAQTSWTAALKRDL